MFHKDPVPSIYFLFLQYFVDELSSNSGQYGYFSQKADYFICTRGIDLLSLRELESLAYLSQELSTPVVFGNNPSLTDDLVVDIDLVVFDSWSSITVVLKSRRKNMKQGAWRKQIRAVQRKLARMFPFSEIPDLKDRLKIKQDVEYYGK